MNTTIKTGDLITWTPWSPMDTGLDFQDFMAFINETRSIFKDASFTDMITECGNIYHL